MTVRSGFYNSLAGDRKYDAVDFGKLFSGIITDGVFLNYGGKLNVTPQGSNMNVVVASGRAWFNNSWLENDSNLILTLDPSEVVLNRIDAIILEVDSSDAVRANTIKILKGTPATTPVNPTLTNTSTKQQYVLAYIYVGTGVSSIISANITNKIGTTGTPWMGGVVSSIDASIVYSQLESQFNIWFDNLVDQLTGVQVTNLQAQIDVEKENNKGWIPLPATLSYVSADSPSFVLSGNADLTSILSRGMRLRYEQTHSLTAYWNFDANSNSQVGSFNGTDTAITYNAGKFSNGASFNGTTSKIVLADNASLKPTGDFTIGMWFKAAPGTTQALFQSYSQNTNRAGILIYVTTTNNILVSIGKNTGATNGLDFLSFTGITDVSSVSAWHYLVITVRNNYLQMYVDGNLDASGYTVAPGYAATNYVRFGCRNDSGTDGSFLNGQIDDPFIINGYALDERHIRLKYRENTAQGTSSFVVKKNALITDVAPYIASATQMTIYGGTDFSTPNTTISNPYFSALDTPFGFNKNENKWTVETVWSSDATQSSPSNNVWYNLGSRSITIPSGSWLVSYSLTLNAIATAGRIDLYSTLSTTNSIESDSYWTVGMVGSSLSIFTTLLSRSGVMNLISKTTYYLNARVLNSTSPTSLSTYSSLVKTIIRCVCAYL